MRISNPETVKGYFKASSCFISLSPWPTEAGFPGLASPGNKSSWTGGGGERPGGRGLDPGPTLQALPGKEAMSS